MMTLISTYHLTGTRLSLKLKLSSSEFFQENINTFFRTAVRSPFLTIVVNSGLSIPKVFFPGIHLQKKMYVLINRIQ